MLLVEITINSTLHRISNEQINSLTHGWDKFIVNMSNVKYALNSQSGGYVRPIYGHILLSPDLFVDDWFPPQTCTIKVMFTDTTEAAAVTLFEGNAYRSAVNRNDVKYQLFGDEYAQTIPAVVWVDDDLEGVFTTYCGASYLNLSTDYTYARATSPDVYKRVDIGTSVIDMLEGFCMATNHLFYIDDGTLYLVDMLLDNGTDISTDEFEFFPATYTDAPLYKQFVSQYVRNYSINGTVGVGEINDSVAAEYIEHLYGTIGDNSGNDQAWLVHSSKLEYETGKYYRIKVKYRRVSGTGEVYAGFVGYATDRTTYVNINGADSVFTQHTIALREGDSATWVTKNGYASGWAATGDNTEHPLPASPAVMHTDVVYVSPLIQANFSAGTGQTDIDYFAVYEVTAAGAIIEELFYDDFTNGFSSEWVNAYVGNGNVETSTSIDESETNVEAALTNLKTILESPRVQLPMPLLAANIPNPGQKITWTDESIGPDGSSVTANIRVRSITFNTDKEELIVEGEGGIT